MNHMNRVAPGSARDAISQRCERHLPVSGWLCKHTMCVVPISVQLPWAVVSSAGLQGFVYPAATVLLGITSVDGKSHSAEIDRIATDNPRIPSAHLRI
jgi:hypothetical protein